MISNYYNEKIITSVSRLKKTSSLVAKMVLVVVILIMTNNKNYAQSYFDIFPSRLLVKPFVANTIKPKLGFEFKNSKNEISLNIGNSIDILHYGIDKHSTFSFGADLFTYTLLTSQSDFHFPVDAVDYLFGVNWGYVRYKGKTEFGARLRLSHISAHFVDGHYDKKNNSWRDDRDPQVYSREFFELIPYYKSSNYRIYAGFTYIYSIDPSDIGQDQYQIGFEYFANNMIYDFITPYLAYDFRLINIYEYSGNNSIEAGIKFGNSDSRGLSLFVRYFSGYNIHGEYFDIKENFTSLGFNFNL